MLLVVGLVGIAGCQSRDDSQELELLRQENGEQSQRLGELQAANEVLQEQVAHQRELLRSQTLASSARSADEFFALFPSRFPAGNWRPAESAFEDCWFTAEDGVRLHAWYLPHRDSRAALLHIHGNAGNLSHRAGIASLLHQRCGASVMIFDYRGYGRSEGTPTILGLLRDARAARAHLADHERVEEKKVVLLGESLGGAIAVDLAATDGARGLILESTFSSLRDVAGVHYPELLVSVLVADKLNSAARIADYHGPLLQVHGDADQTIPLESGRRLFAAASEPKSLHVLPRHDHNDPLPEAYYQALERFLRDLPQN
jgi:fermentation-respiration switch protein FrsA (DUF1100 family)